MADAGQAELIKALGAHISEETIKTSLCQTSDLDAFGTMTRNGVISTAGAFCLDDPTMKAKGRYLSKEAKKKFFDVQNNCQFAASYAGACLPRHVARLISANPKWFEHNKMKAAQKLYKKENITDLDEDSKAGLRSITIFPVDGFLRPA